MKFVKSLRSKATLRVKRASLFYDGSISISRELAGALSIPAYAEVDVNNRSTGARVKTYVIIKDDLRKWECEVNGAAAHHFAQGNWAHINFFKYYSEGVGDRIDIYDGASDYNTEHDQQEQYNS